ncbi:MAG: N-acetylmuramoyl-L-alanine amidase [Saprospiraceae bacterium]
MPKQYGFTLIAPAEFEAWLAAQSVARTVFTVQLHHTFAPNYAGFNGKNHFALQKGMQNFHTLMNGWQDIGQHFSIFPDGMIVTGRNLESSPACIFGFNAHSICIENIGNFDVGGDEMRLEQREAILGVTAALCRRFRIPVNPNQIVYHHWFDLKTGQRTNGAGMTKSCPGSNFFGGNTVEAAETNFLPHVQAILDHQPDQPPLSVAYYATVTTNNLNIRDKPDVSGRRINVTSTGAVLRVYEEKNNWCRIAANRQEWVSGKYLRKQA